MKVNKVIYIGALGWSKSIWKHVSLPQNFVAEFIEFYDKLYTVLEILNQIETSIQQCHSCIICASSYGVPMFLTIAEKLHNKKLSKIKGIFLIDGLQFSVSKNEIEMIEQKRQEKYDTKTQFLNTVLTPEEQLDETLCSIVLENYDVHNQRIKLDNNLFCTYLSYFIEKDFKIRFRDFLKQVNDKKVYVAQVDGNTELFANENVVNIAITADEHLLMLKRPELVSKILQELSV